MHMKKKWFLALFLVSILSILALSSGFFVQTRAEESTENCETCPMMVNAEAQDHLKVYDGEGTIHYVECIGCALKLLKTFDTLHIVTYCDWYGPEYTITIDISGSGANTIVDPPTATTLIGGGCTGNRVAYNETAAEALLANGFSHYTMAMMQQALPANTNVTSVSARALTFVGNQEETPAPQSPLIWVLLGVVAIAVVAGSIIAFKKLKK
jgi:hypothetical protein